MYSGGAGGGAARLSALQRRMKERGHSLYMSVFGVISEGSDRTRTMIAHNYRMKSIQNYIPITSIEDNLGDIEIACRIIIIISLKEITL